MMNEIINRIFNHYSYIEHEVNLPDGLKFYKHCDKSIASYFIINQIDCRPFEDDEDAMIQVIDRLEKDYSFKSTTDRKSIKNIIQSSFEYNGEASQIDKNTSAIYLILLSDMEKIELYRNLIFAIEESPNYFKRYLIPYTESQVQSLSYTISNYEDREINDILSDIANNEDEYYKLLDGNNVGSEYEFVIRLFSKIPFLQYKFKADPAPLSIENEIQKKLEEKLSNYHKAIQKEVITIDEILRLESGFLVDDEKIEQEIDALLGGE